jgi:hypothetical protein
MIDILPGAMNTLTLAASVVGDGSPKGLLISFLVAVLVIGAIGGLLYCIDRWIHTIPDPARLVIAIVLVVCLIFWAINAFM